MPFCEADPWRLQYFEGVECPPQLCIPTEDPDAYLWYPAHRWVYDKLRVAESQGLSYGPHGVYPPQFPVFSKPIANLQGMGVGSEVLTDPEHYRRQMRPGYFWMTLLQGEHLSSDIAIVAGRAAWWRHVCGRPAGRGAFDYWTIEAGHRPQLESFLAGWLASHLASYTGMINLETIGGRIIDVHLRFSDQWPDLYGRGWLDAVVGLYGRGAWVFDDRERRDGYSVVLFGPHGREHLYPSAELVARVRAMPQVTSVQITFHPDRPAAAHLMPPGGFRLAIVNCLELQAGRAARAVLAAHFDG
jgi:hypothetical protein